MRICAIFLCAVNHVCNVLVGDSRALGFNRCEFHSLYGIYPPFHFLCGDLSADSILSDSRCMYSCSDSESESSLGLSRVRTSAYVYIVLVTRIRLFFYSTQEIC